MAGGTLDYQINFKSDQRGVIEATRSVQALQASAASAQTSLQTAASSGGRAGLVFSQLGQNVGSARMALYSVQMAAAGGTSSIMGLLGVMRSLWMTMAGGNPIILAAVVAFAALAKGVQVVIGHKREYKRRLEDLTALELEFSERIREQREEHGRVALSIDRHRQAVVELVGNYKAMSDAADKYAAAAKGEIDTDKRLALAKSRLAESVKLIGAIGAPERQADIRGASELERLDIEHRAALQAAEAERAAIERKIRTATAERSALQEQLYAAPEIGQQQSVIAQQQGQLKRLAMQRAAAQEGGVMKTDTAALKKLNDEWLKVNDQIAASQQKLEELKTKEHERHAAIHQQWYAQEALVDELNRQLKQNSLITDAINAETDAERERLRVAQLMEQQLARETEQREALAAQIKAAGDEERAAIREASDLRRAGTAAVREAHAKADSARTAADEAWERAYSKTGKTAAEVEADKIAKQRARDIARATREAERVAAGGPLRPRLSKKSQRILEAVEAEKAAEAAKAAAAAADKRMQDDIARSEDHLDEIRVKLATLLEARG